MYNAKQIFLRDERGDTLIEVLVSLSVLVIGIFSIVALITGQLRFNRGVADRLTAIELTNEGVELIRAERDARVWQGLSPTFIQGSSPIPWCEDWQGVSPVGKPGDVCLSTPLKKDANGRYSYAPGIDTTFVRYASISCEAGSGGNFQNVVVTVNYASGQSYSTSTRLFDWSNPNATC